MNNNNNNNNKRGNNDDTIDNHNNNNNNSNNKKQYTERDLFYSIFFNKYNINNKDNNDEKLKIIIKLLKNDFDKVLLDNDNYIKNFNQTIQSWPNDLLCVFKKNNNEKVDNDNNNNNNNNDDDDNNNIIKTTTTTTDILLDNDNKRKYWEFIKNDKNNNIIFLKKYLGIINDTRRGVLFNLLCEDGDLCRTKFAWAIPDERAISIMGFMGPIIEIGAGHGYWAYLVDKIFSKNNHNHNTNNNNSIIDSYDKYTFMNKSKNWFNVKDGGPEVLLSQTSKSKMKKDAKGKGKSNNNNNNNDENENDNDNDNEIDERTLFLCYPDDFEESNESLGVKCLENFNGNYVIHCGELFGDTISMEQQPWGRTTSSETQEYLFHHFHCLLKAPLPRWPISRDCISVWKRTSSIDMEMKSGDDNNDDDDDDDDDDGLNDQEEIIIQTYANISSEERMNVYKDGIAAHDYYPLLAIPIANDNSNKCNEKQNDLKEYIINLRKKKFIPTTTSTSTSTKFSDDDNELDYKKLEQIMLLQNNRKDQMNNEYYQDFLNQSTLWSMSDKLKKMKYIFADNTTTYTNSSNGKVWESLVFQDNEERMELMEFINSQEEEFYLKYGCHGNTIPDERAIKIMVYYSPLIQISNDEYGYWAKCITDNGGKITVYDINKEEDEQEAEEPITKTYIDFDKILPGGPEILALEEHQTKTLLLNYIDINPIEEEEEEEEDSDDENENGNELSSAATKKTILGLLCLESFQGDTIIHIGELFGDSLNLSQGPWGSSTYRETQEYLVSNFTMVLKAPLPNFPKTQNTISVWKRKAVVELVIDDVDDDDNDDDDHHHDKSNDNDDNDNEEADVMNWADIPSGQEFGERMIGIGMSKNIIDEDITLSPMSTKGLSFLLDLKSLENQFPDLFNPNLKN